MEKEIYLKLTEDEIEDVIYALHHRNDSFTSNSMNYDTSETDSLIQKIFDQKYRTVRRPYVVSGTHYHQMLKLPRRLVVMAEEPKWAIEYAKEHVEKEGGTFEVDANSVHEMGEDEIVFAEDFE